MNPFRRCLLFASLLFSACFGAGAFAGEIHYQNFSAPAGLIFQGDATLNQNFVRLTPSHRDQLGRVGGLWLEQKQAVRQGFESTFTFRITEKVGYGADGFAFVLQNAKAPSLGLSGHHLGYSRSGDAFAVVFDTYHWHRTRYVRYDEIAVTSSGKDQDPRKVGNPLGTVTAPGMYSDGEVHTARLRYRPGRMEVFLDDLEKPVLKVNVRLEDFVSLEGDLAWVGFTASTGADSQNHDILAWSFGDPGKTTIGALAGTAPVSPTPNRTVPLPANAASPGASSTSVAVPNVAAANSTADVRPLTIGLPVESVGNSGGVRMQLPASVTLNNEVYASEDLVNWTLVTNLSLYFSDPAGTNYDRRFYTFREKVKE